MSHWFPGTRAVWLCLVLLLRSTVALAQATAVTAQPASTESKAAPCDRYGLVTVVRCMGHDLLGIGNRESLIWLGVGGVLAGASVPADDEVARAFADSDHGAAFALGDHLGFAGVQFGVPAAAYFISRATGHQNAADLSIMLVRTQVVNAVFTRGLKMLPRARPNQTDATPAQGSFPSGHTSASFATATVLQRKWGWRAGVPAYAVAGFIGVTRLHNEHYLSDVTFGAALGIASGLAVKMPSPRVALTPAISPGRAGLFVTIGPRS
jgi:hypothetical protein